MNKIMILTESAGNPRSHPKADKTTLEETYPYILRTKFPNSLFWQLSYGNVTTEDLVNQATGYLEDWCPDVIIVHSGINDCRPQAFTVFELNVINKFTGPFFRFLRKHLYSPKLIKWRNKNRVTKSSFKKTLLTLKISFPKAKIYWLELTVDPEYEKIRPGVLKKIKEYNKIIHNIFNDNFVYINDSMLSNLGFNKDKLHWNKRGHTLVANKILSKLSNLD